MLLTEYNEATAMEMFKEEGRKEGLEEGRKEGRQEGRKEGLEEGRQEATDAANKRVASEMLQDGEPLKKVVKYSRLSESVVRQLARSLGVAVL